MNTNPASLIAGFRVQAEANSYAAHDDARFLACYSRATVQDRVRFLIERAVIRCAVADVLAAGYAVSVFDGHVTSLRLSTSLIDVMNSVMQGANDTLRVYKLGPARHKIGEIQTAYGLDGWNVIDDHSPNLTDVLARADVLADSLREVMA